MNVVFHGHLGGLFGRLEERPDVDVEPEVGHGGGNHLGAAVVSVLTELGDEHARAAALVFLEAGDELANLGDVGVVAELGAVHAGDRADLGLVTAEDHFARVGDFAEGGARLGGGDGELEQVTLAGLGALGDGREGGLDGGFVAVGTELLEALDLRLAHSGVVDLEDVEGGFLFEAVLVEADDGLLTGVDLGLAAGGGFLDAELRDAGLDGLGHAAHFLDFVEVGAGLGDELLREGFDVVAAAPRIDDITNAGFLLELELGVARDAGREVGGQRDGFVERVGVQGLRVAGGGSHGFEAGAGDVVERVLLGERPTGGLRVRAQGARLRVLRVEAVDDLGPEEPAGAHLGDFHVEVFADGPEEREARREGVDVDAGGDAGLQILETVGERVGELEVGGGACLLHVVAGDRDRVELRHVLRRVGEDVRDDLHGGRGRIDVGIPHHELLEDVVLDRAGELFQLRTLFEGGDDVEREHGQHGTVHRHRDGDLVQRDVAEQDFHVEDRVDGHAGLADVADDARVVAVVAAVGREIERDRQTGLTGGEVALIKRVGLFRGGEAGVLAHGPGLLDVHRGVRAAHEGREAGHRVELLDGRQVGGRVNGLHRDLLVGEHRLVFDDRGLARELERVVAELAEIGDVAHFRVLQSS
ncbi:MAG: hypothetical protein BWX86_00461 [Verrucomicrobia bacterium ADurb.Bin122]|nr:MAG: hypothetical protein BWX86_00461 [Verrucomicrobia bacterium ADurb.Bin122]